MMTLPKMRRQLLLLFLPFFLLFFFLGFPTLAHAATVTLSGSVKDSSGNAIGNANVSVNDPNNDTTTTDPTTGQYSLTIPSGTYNVQVTPPSGSGFSSAIAYSQNISADTTLNFILTPSGTVTLKGHVYDELGNPVSNQVVSFNNVTSTTDASGNYSISVAPATNQLQISYAASNPPNYSLNVPNNYIIQNNSFPLTKDITLDIMLPARKVTVHVQDPSTKFSIYY